MLLYTNALRTDAFTHKALTDWHTHTDTFTHRCGYTQKVALDPSKSQFYLGFWRSNLVLCENVTTEVWKSHFTSVFEDRTSFRAKGLPPTLENRNLTSAFDDRTAKGLRRTQENGNFTLVFDEPHFLRKSCDRQLKIASLHELLTIELRKGCAGRKKMAILP